MEGKGRIMGGRKLVVLALVVILIIDIVVRLGMIGYAGFFEPDGFFHYAVITYAVSHGLSIPNTLNLSGFPTHNLVSETEGFYYITIIPWLILGKSISYYTIMRLIPVLFGMLDALGAFFLARYLVRSDVLGLLAAFFVATSNGDIARTAALVYRGDGFSTIFVIVAMILLVKGFSYKLGSAEGQQGSGSIKRVALYGLGSAFVLSIASAIWNGAPYAVITYMLALILATVYGFISARKALLKNTFIMGVALVFDYILVHAYMALDIIRGQALTSLHFFLFYLPVLAAALLAWIIIENKDKLAGIAGSAATRSYFIIALLVIGVIAVLVIGGNYISSVASGGGLVIAGNNLTETIQELQKPTFGFLFSSFMLQLFLAPLGIILFLLFARRIGSRGAAQGVGDGDVTGRRFSLYGNINAGSLVLFAYIATTAYLQYNAIRFNSLLAVPLAIFSAYGVYGAYMLVRNAKLRKFQLRYVYLGVTIAILVYAVAFAYMSSETSAPADGINAQFLSAMSWMRNNTPQNATVLALWPDGSVVEGWAHRTSLMDSVGGQNSMLIYNFSRFLFNKTNSSAYLYSAGKPEYVVSRGYWLAEIGGIAQEGNITGTKAQPYGYTLMSSYNRKVQGNETVYTFVTAASDTINGAALILNQTSRNTTNTTAYIHTGSSSQYYRIANIIFYNTTGLGSQLISTNSTGELNYTLMLFYSGPNIQGATVLGPALPESNFFKLIYGCTDRLCNYTGPEGNASLRLVYGNTDTRIYKVSYS